MKTKLKKKKKNIFTKLDKKMAKNKKLNFKDYLIIWLMVTVPAVIIFLSCYFLAYVL